MIRFDKFTQKAQEAIQQAQTLAEKNQNQAIHPIHLFVALAGEREGVVRPILEKSGVDKAGKIIGIVTEADIIAKVDRTGLCVADIMSPEIIVVGEETPVGEIAMLLTERRIKRVPVMQNGKLVGIVCRADIVQAVAQGHLITRHW